jgi:hypothetical protein
MNSHFFKHIVVSSSPWHQVSRPLTLDRPTDTLSPALGAPRGSDARRQTSAIARPCLRLRDVLMPSLLAKLHAS